MKKMTEAMRIFAYDKASKEEKAIIAKMYGATYYGLRTGDVVPEIGMQLELGGNVITITAIEWLESHNIIQVTSDKGKQGWPTISAMILAGKVKVVA